MQCYYTNICYYVLYRIILKDGKPEDYEFLDVNPACERVLGVPRDRIVGKRAADVSTASGSRFTVTLASTVGRTLPGFSRKSESRPPGS